jgi:hypothetical protein
VALLAAKFTGVFPPEPRKETLTLPGTKKDFALRLFQAIGTVAPNTSLFTRALVVAHAAYETDWGKGFAAAKGNNFWNLTAGTVQQPVSTGIWAGPVVLGGDTEYKPGDPVPAKIVQRFRAYPTWEAAVSDYFLFLSSARYRDAKAKLLAGDPTFVIDLGVFTLSSNQVVRAWADAGKGGFYTLPIPTYVRDYNDRLNVVRVLLTTELSRWSA